MLTVYVVAPILPVPAQTEAGTLLCTPSVCVISQLIEIGAPPIVAQYSAFVIVKSKVAVVFSQTVNDSVLKSTSGTG